MLWEGTLNRVSKVSPRMHSLVLASPFDRYFDITIVVGDVA